LRTGAAGGAGRQISGVRLQQRAIRSLKLLRPAQVALHRQVGALQGVLRPPESRFRRMHGSTDDATLGL
ncbi:hypothetical protein, partial [Pseudomonas sp. 2FG]|uniref:hypothetical protein n=1 Tax=Pseudomonas sp. 2FG TaxID=2502191 RepID=UPI001C498997